MTQNVQITNKVIAKIAYLAAIPNYKIDGVFTWFAEDGENAFTRKGFTGYTNIWKADKICPRLLLEQVIAIYNLDEPAVSRLSDPKATYDELTVAEWKQALMLIPSQLMIGQGPIILPNKQLLFPQAQSEADASRFLQVWNEAGGPRISSNPNASIGEVIALLRIVLGTTPHELLGSDLYSQITDDLVGNPLKAKEGIACLSKFGIGFEINKDTSFGKPVPLEGEEISGMSKKSDTITRMVLGAAWIGVTAFLIHRARK